MSSRKNLRESAEAQPRRPAGRRAPARAPEPASAARQILEVIAACAGDPDFMTSFARGLAVMQAFTGHSRQLSVSQVSLETGIPRAAARRALYTLVRLGYVGEQDGGYVLLPRVLGIGNAYLSSASIAVLAQPVLDDLRDRMHESCSLGILDNDEVLYVARAETVRIMSIGLHPGSRIPAYCSSIGRVLLAGLAPAALAAYLKRVPLRPRTERTVVDTARLHEILQKVRRSGACIVDQELELGLRSTAVPVHNPRGEVVAALNIGTQTARIPLRMLESELLPALKEAATQLEALLR